MVREDTYQMTVQYDASYGIPYDLTGATVTMIAKADPQMLDSAAIFTLGIGTGISVPTPTAGTIYVTISSANTANMAGLLSSACYSLVVENGSFRKTLLQGRISVTPSVLN
jgi:hypothetical protein